MARTTYLVAERRGVTTSQSVLHTSGAVGRVVTLGVILASFLTATSWRVNVFCHTSVHGGLPKALRNNGVNKNLMYVHFIFT